MAQVSWQLHFKIQLHSCHTVLTNIATVFVNVLELAESLDDVKALAGPGDDELGALVQAVVEDLESLEDVSPILSLIVQALVEHVHNLVEFGRAISAASRQSVTAPHVYGATGGGGRGPTERAKLTC